jgi:hypothetical protein
LGYSQAVRHQTLNLTFPWFESKYPSHAYYREAILCFFYTFFLDYRHNTDIIPTLLPTQYRHFQIYYRHFDCITDIILSVMNDQLSYMT